MTASARFGLGWAVYVVLAVACSALLMPAAAPANEPDSDITGSLPGGGLAAHQGLQKLEPEKAPPGRLIILGFAGDLGFSGKDQPLSTAGAIRHGRVIPWDELVSGVAPLLEADATFANLETVITDRPGLASVDKAFNFLASPAGLRAAVGAGINVITAANNHAADFGEEGIADTLRHLEAERAAGLKAHVGLGQGDERYRAEVLDLQGTSVGVSAVGKGINPAGPDGYGQPLYASRPDFDRVSAVLRETGADVRVLSVHYGEELNLLPSEPDRMRLRSTVTRGDANIVFGHHSHVASGVERRGDAVIFYGLGNFLHAGTQDMARYGHCRDFGLHAKVYLWSVPGHRPVLRAVEVTPISDMHEIAKPFSPEDAASRIAVVNAMSEELSQGGGTPVHFTPTGTGSGLACVPGPAIYGDALEQRCRSLASPLMNVTTDASASLTSCKALPQVRLATGEKGNSPGQAMNQDGKPKKQAEQTGKTRKTGKSASAERPKAKAPRKFFLFNRSD